MKWSLQEGPKEITYEMPKRDFCLFTICEKLDARAEVYYDCIQNFS